MTNTDLAAESSHPLPVADGDFYLVSRMLSSEDEAIRLKVRFFMEPVKFL
jgi:hypothetical protein